MTSDFSPINARTKEIRSIWHQLQWVRVSGLPAMGTMVTVFGKYHGFHFHLCHYVSIGTCVSHLSSSLWKAGLVIFLLFSTLLLVMQHSLAVYINKVYQVTYNPLSSYKSPSLFVDRVSFVKLLLFKWETLGFLCKDFILQGMLFPRTDFFCIMIL